MNAFHENVLPPGMEQSPTTQSIIDADNNVVAALQKTNSINSNSKQRSTTSNTKNTNRNAATSNN